MATGRRRPATKNHVLLPSAGRDGPIPACPYEGLNESAMEWWEAAWRTPQSTAWDDGTIYTVAQRAFLEQQITSSPPEAVPSLIAQASRLDDALGLTPKGMKALGWEIAPTAQTAARVVGLDSYRNLDFG